MSELDLRLRAIEKNSFIDGRRITVLETKNGALWDLLGASDREIFDINKRLTVIEQQIEINVDIAELLGKRIATLWEYINAE